MNPLNMRPTISKSAARLILKNVPRSFLHVSTGVIRDAKTMEILGHVEPETLLIGKKFIREGVETNESENSIIFHKNSKKYRKTHLKRVVQILNNERERVATESVQDAA